jgi:putative ABC transport system permease protein
LLHGLIMTASLLFVRLAVQHLKSRPVRTGLLVFAVAVGGGALFSAAVLRQALGASLSAGLDRLGADLMVVPPETTVNLTAALLTVEPLAQMLAVASDEIDRIPGVEVAAPQQYLPLPGGGDGHAEGIVAFEPQRDFTIVPWLADKLDRPLRRGDVIVGARRPESVGAELRLFGQSLPIYGKLALTGVGPFERGLFVSFETAEDLAAAAQATTGRALWTPSRAHPSALLIRLAAGSTPEQFRFAAARLPGIQVVAGSGLNTSVRQGMSTLLRGTILFAALTLLATALMIGVVYVGLVDQRRRELGLLLSLGMRPRQLTRLVLAEAALTTGLGGICGVIFGVGVLMFVQRSQGYSFASLEAPLLMPPLRDLATMGLASVVLCAAVGAAGALVPAWRASRCEPYVLVAGNG